MHTLSKCLPLAVLRLLPALAPVLALSITAPAMAQSATGKAAAGVEAPKERLPTDFRRLTILVRDMENSLKLYRDVIGLKLNYDQRLTVSGVALPAAQREVIALKIDGGLTFAEIAAVIGTSANTAASRYRYALEKLRAALATNEVPR
jgi:hypothetical protein